LGRFFVAYRDVACTIYPVVTNTTVFEETLNVLLINRANFGGDENMINFDKPFGVSVSWLALLFAVLASGAQSTNRPAKERELTSQVYSTSSNTPKHTVMTLISVVCCSYQALRMANFLTHPSLEAIQAFLIIGNVLSYNMNPGVAYILIGLTMRMAFSLGLQADSQTFSPEQQYTRRRVWWAIAWQDSHFSVSYDRPSASAFCCPEIPYRSVPGQRSYAESMFRIIKLTQEIIRERTMNPRTTMSWQTIQSYKEEVARTIADSAPHLRDRRYGKGTIQNLERCAFRLHACYITSELCRPSLKESVASSSDIDSANPTPAQSPIVAQGRRKSSRSIHSPQSSSASFDPTLKAQIRRDCITNLEGTISAYIEAHSLSPFAARSWIGIQRAVSAGFLLGTLRETNQEPHIHSLLRELEEVIIRRTKDDPSFDTAADGQLSPGGGKAQSPHWATIMAKSLKALGKLNKALQQPPPPVLGQHYIVQANSNGPGIALHTNFGGSIGAGGLPMQMYQPVTAVNLTHEPFSPDYSGTGVMTTPDSTSSGDWNYANIQERASEFVTPAIWE